MNRSEIIAKVRAHAEAQGTPCCTARGEPAYQLDGKACFIGHLLGRAYQPGFDGIDPWTHVPLLQALAKQLGLKVNETLVDLVHEVDNAHTAWIDGTPVDWQALATP